MDAPVPQLLVPRYLEGPTSQTGSHEGSGAQGNPTAWPWYQRGGRAQPGWPGAGRRCYLERLFSPLHPVFSELPSSKRSPSSFSLSLHPTLAGWKASRTVGDRVSEQKGRAQGDREKPAVQFSDAQVPHACFAVPQPLCALGFSLVPVKRTLPFPCSLFSRLLPLLPLSSHSAALSPPPGTYGILQGSYLFFWLGVALCPRGERFCSQWGLREEGMSPHCPSVMSL